MKDPVITLTFPDVPLWTGIHADCPPVQRFPLILGMHEDGFICQTTDKDIRDAVVAAYAKDTYNFITPPLGASSWAEELMRRKLSLLLAENRSFGNLRILEIGGANMELGRAFVERFGVSRYVVVDPALRHSPHPRQLECLRGYFPHPDLAGETFDVVLSLSCLEHVPDPVAFLSAIRMHLRDSESFAYLTFPEIGQQFAVGDLNAILHEHLNYFNVASFRRLVSRLGLQVKRYEVNADLMSCILGKSDVHESDMAPDGRLLQAAFRSFPEALRRAKLSVRKDLSEGKTIAFYGANNGLNMFLDYCDFPSGESIVIVDGDRAKAGLRMPVGDHPIQHMAEIQFGTNRKTYVSATSFYAEICEEIARAAPLPGAIVRPLFG